jgi:hypothetical protein
MLVESQWSAEEQFAGGVLCRQVQRLRKLYSHFVLRGSEQLKTVRDERGWLWTADTKVPFVTPLRIEWDSSFTEALPLLILPSR